MIKFESVQKLLLRSASNCWWLLSLELLCEIYVYNNCLLLDWFLLDLSSMLFYLLNADWVFIIASFKHLPPKVRWGGKCPFVLGQRFQIWGLRIESLLVGIVHKRTVLLYSVSLKIVVLRALKCVTGGSTKWVENYEVQV